RLLVTQHVVRSPVLSGADSRRDVDGVGDSRFRCETRRANSLSLSGSREIGVSNFSFVCRSRAFATSEWRQFARSSALTIRCEMDCPGWGVSGSEVRFLVICGEAQKFQKSLRRNSLTVIKGVGILPLLVVEISRIVEQNGRFLREEGLCESDFLRRSQE